ncbi:hypothetical protein, partial [Escherichia coli]|uniref:hypothetical protein n=1 Tax=Escherichia coli TaxID=562 RepID=UPI0022E8425E
PRQIASSTRSNSTKTNYYFLSSFTCLISDYTAPPHNTKGIKMTVHGISENSTVHLREKNGEWLVVRIIRNDDITYQLRNIDTDEEVIVTLQDIISPNK